jgi:hypothetical protein
MFARRPALSHLTPAWRSQVLLLALGASVAQAEPGETPAGADENVPERKMPAVSLLPAGSVLRKVMIPRYDQQRKLSAVLRAAVMTIVDPQTIEGEQVSLDLYNPDRSRRARIDLEKAHFDQRKGTLDARQPVAIAGENFSAHGSGLIYTYEKARGFLLGPVNTRFHAPPPKTSMIRPPSPRTAATALAATLIASPAGAEPPARLTPEERVGLVAQAAPVADKVERAQTEVKQAATAGQAEAAKVDADVAKFAEEAELKEVATPPPAPTGEGKPLEIKPGPNDTIIEAKDGMYFDAENGVLVYLKDVQLTDPRFTLSGANELKVFLEKKPAPAKPDKADKPGTPTPDGEKGEKAAKEKAAPGLVGASGGFGDVDRIVATGAVRVVQKPADGKAAVEASAAVLTYYAKTGEIVLHGGYPWVKQGDKFMRAKQPDLYLRIQKDGSFVTEGLWDMGGELSNPNKPKQP